MILLSVLYITNNACYRMRDLSNQDKQEVQRLTKANEKFVSEMSVLRKDKERFAAEVEEMSQQMIDLKEQVRVKGHIVTRKAVQGGSVFY